MNTTLTLRERVARGARLLDEKRPGWAAEISVEELRMTSCLDCVLGQLYGDYRKGTNYLYVSSGTQLGFDLNFSDYPEFTEPLNELWLAEIARRTGRGEDAGSSAT